MDIWWGRRSASVLGAALLTVGAVVGGELALGAVLGGSDPPAGGVARTALSPYRDGAFTVRAAAVDRRVGIESARDGSYVLGHAPAGNEVVLDLDLLDGASARPWWVEPATGRVLELAELASEGVARFPAPGAEYWVLVIDDAAAGYASPDAGTIAELVRSVTDGPDQPGQAGSSGGGVGRLDDAPAAGAGQGRSGFGQDGSGRTDRSNGDDPERENGSGGSPDGGLDDGSSNGEREDGSSDGGRDSGSSNGRLDDGSPDGGLDGGSPDGGPDGGSFNGERDGGSSNGGRDGGSPDGGLDDGSPNDGRDDHDSGPGDGRDGGPAIRGSGNGDDGSADRPGTSDHLGPSSGTDPADRTFTGEREKPDTQQARPEETAQPPSPTPAPTPAPAPAPEKEPAPPPESEPEAAADASWDRLAQCESSGDWAISTGNGYYGGLQFDEPTWREFGGGQFAPTADGASKDQQIEIATKVRDTRGGYGSWPACARKVLTEQELNTGR